MFDFQGTHIFKMAHQRHPCGKEPIERHNLESNWANHVSNSIKPAASANLRPLLGARADTDFPVDVPVFNITLAKAGWGQSRNMSTMKTLQCCFLLFFEVKMPCFSEQFGAVTSSQLNLYGTSHLLEIKKAENQLNFKTN